ncbi:GNAT family N-acetyltransferase [Arenibacter sp. GZD96]|uniref:GNAT family N-acetyltransferase n=1 Tax=Aurantibrevibacter litoralis TaxID=3106030 RepID=UPI002AFFCA09|nr:GNAT family N-acetyltransferase [Arenibacter sp. GZD-96]MEA1787385.1 GNAT family N-acetyltransferase [Arenibacter sp. GZD-96]
MWYDKRIPISKPLNFLNLLLEERKVAFPYVKITHTLCDRVVYDKPRIEPPPLNSTILTVLDVPSYLNLETAALSGLKMHKIPTYKGSLITLKNYRNLDDYLKKNFSYSRRSKLRMYRKRLEQTFPITYKAFYGDIAKTEYDGIFEALHNMLDQRFAQKQTTNDDLQRWNVYLEKAYALILKKEACLFVIYDGEKPISICLNLIFDKTIFGYIRAYDIDYSKFALGFTDLLVQLEWYFANGFEIFDLLKGEYDYKTKLTDGYYYFEKYLVYGTGSPITVLRGTCKLIGVKTFYSLYRLLKKWKVNTYYHKLRSVFHKKQVSQIEKCFEISDIDLVDYGDVKAKEPELTELDLYSDNLAFLRKPIYDFLYANREHRNEVHVWGCPKKKDLFYIVGKTKVQQLVFNLPKENRILEKTNMYN